MTTDETSRPAVRAAPLDLSAATPELYAALAKAQSEMETVGKDGTNDQRGYNYATAEAMIHGSRGPLGANGLAVFSTWSRDDTTFQPGGDIGQQFVCATVRVYWVCSHASGGLIRGTAEIDAIGSRARPPDKAITATLTYVRGFLLRDLLNMDRGRVDPDEVVDQRQEPKHDPRWDAFQTAVRRLATMRKLAGTEGFDAAYAMVRVEAKIQPGKDGPTDAQLIVLTEVAERMAKPQLSPLGKLNAAIDKLAKARGISPKEACKLAEGESNIQPGPGGPTDAEVVTLLGSAERLLAAPKEQPESAEYTAWRTAARLHVKTRTDDYATCEGEEPGSETTASFWETVQTISAKAAKKKAPKDFAPKAATAKQLKAAADALNRDRTNRGES